LFTVTIDVIDAAPAKFGMFGVVADVFAVMPAAHAFRMLAGNRLHQKPAAIAQGEHIS
jgi:hypothetical protein